MVVERFIIDQLPERTFLRTHVRNHGVHATDSGVHTSYRCFQISCFDVRNDRIEISDSGVGIINDTGYLRVHDPAQVTRHIGQVAGYTIDVRQGRFEMIALQLTVQLRHKRIYLLHRIRDLGNQLVLQVLHDTREIHRRKGCSMSYQRLLLQFLGRILGEQQFQRHAA